MARWGWIVVKLERDESRHSAVPGNSYGKFPDAERQHCSLAQWFRDLPTLELASVKLRKGCKSYTSNEEI